MHLAYDSYRIHIIVCADYAKLVRNGSLGNTQSDQQQHLAQDSASQNQYSGFPPPTLGNIRHHHIPIASPFPSSSSSNHYAYGSSRENDQHPQPYIPEEGSMRHNSTTLYTMMDEEIGHRDQ